MFISERERKFEMIRGCRSHLILVHFFITNYALPTTYTSPEEKTQSYWSRVTR